MPKRKRSTGAMRMRKAKRKGVVRAARSLRRQVREQTNVQRGPNPFGSRAIARLRYVERVNLSSSNDTPSVYYFRLNSMFDPNESGTGHQPLGFDEYAKLFQRYRVFKCKARLVVMPQSIQTGQRFALGVQNNSTSWAGLSMDAIAEKPRVYVKQLNVNAPNTLRHSWYLPRVMGMTSTQYRSDDRTSALVTDNPAEACNVNMVYSNPALSAQTGYCDLYLTYYVEFFDPVLLAQS